MADRRRRKVGQIWRCNRSEFGYRRGDEIQILDISASDYAWENNQFMVKLLNRERPGGAIRNMDSNRLTSRDDRWEFVREEPIGELPINPYIMRCRRCGGRDIVERQLPPQNHIYTCPSCERPDNPFTVDDTIRINLTTTL